MTTTRARNYKSKPHTARFLMAFHAAAYGLPSDVTETAKVDAVATDGKVNVSPTTKGAPMTTTTERMATGNMAHYILDFKGMSRDDDNRPEAALAIMETMTFAEARKQIETLKAERDAKREAEKVAASIPALKPAKAASTGAPTTEGLARGQWHCFNDAFYLVCRSQSTGNLYAKVRLAGGGFEYTPGIMGKLSTATLVGPQHADMIKAFGDMWDACMFCMKPLDLPESRQAGCGERCAGKHGIPYGS